MWNPFKVKIMTRRQWRFLVSLLLTLKSSDPLCWFFHCWLWISKNRLGSSFKGLHKALSLSIIKKRSILDVATVLDPPLNTTFKANSKHIILLCKNGSELTIKPPGIKPGNVTFVTLVFTANFERVYRVLVFTGDSRHIPGYWKLIQVTPSF